MTVKSGMTRNDLAYTAVVHRFPNAEPTIQRLMNDSEEFQDLCADLADAQVALDQVSKITAAFRRSRRKEWEDLIATLLSEIRDVLNKHGCDAGKSPQ
jgi:hypothetical protein